MDSRGIIHKEFVPPGQTVNQHFYLKVLEKLSKRVARVVRPGIKENGCFTTTMRLVTWPCQFLVKKFIPVVSQPPYLPDLDPVTSFPFKG